ncbi:restriction endonuclease subunit S [Corynebacterium mayonis]|uniref:restriction endonuclease subunit S n=1 Tax=Corynebacterium mayonis TaxID=3062461 RepID=UPI003140B295
MNRTVSLRHYADVNPRTNEFKEVAEGESLAFLPLENIWPSGSADYSQTKAWKNTDTSYTQFRRGDILVPKVTPTVFHGRSMIAETETEVGLATSEVHVLRPKNGADARWITYNLLSSQFLDRARGAVHGVGGLQRISSSYLGSYKVVETGIPNQKRIADYLDRETAEIDAAVADLDRYVELLSLRRISIVERRLVEASYEMCPIGLLANVTLGKMVSTKAQDDGVLQNYLRAAHVQPGGRLDFSAPERRMYFSASEAYRLNLLKGDVVVVEGGAGFGRSAILDTDLPNWGFQNSINRLRVKPSKADPRFVNYMLMRALQNGSIDLATDTATIPHFTAEKLSRFRIPVCSLADQVRFSDTIDRETATLDSLISESTKLRDLLLKRRSVLITEVVTGRKKV